MTEVKIAAAVLAAYAVYTYSTSSKDPVSAPGQSSKDRSKSGAPSTQRIPPGCHPGLGNGPPICPPTVPGSGVSKDPLRPLQPPPSQSNPFQPVTPVATDPWRSSTATYPQVGCFINRNYDPSASDPWLPSAKQQLGRGWTPDMATFSSEPSACVLNEKALQIARQYNNAGLPDEKLLTYSAGSTCYQWQSDPSAVGGGSLATVPCLGFVPMGPVGHEYPQPQPPPPPQAPTPPTPPTPPSPTPPIQSPPISKSSGVYQLLGFELKGVNYALPEVRPGQTVESCRDICNADANCQFAVLNNSTDPVFGQGRCYKRQVPAHKNQTTQLRTTTADGHSTWSPVYSGGLDGWDLQKTDQPDQASCSAFCVSAWSEAVYPGQPDKWATMAMYDSGDKKCFCKKSHPDKNFITLIKQAN